MANGNASTPHHDLPELGHLPELAEFRLDLLKEKGLSGTNDSTKVRLKQDSPEGDKGLRKGGEAQAARLDNNQVIWLQLDADEREVKVFDEPLATDRAIIAALTTLEAGTENGDRLRQAILIYLFCKEEFKKADSDKQPSLSKEFLDDVFVRLREGLREADTHPLLHDGRPEDCIAALGGARTFYYIEKLLQYFRPEYDELAIDERAALIEGACARVGEFRTGLQNLMAYLEYGSQGKKLKPAIRDARRDIKAAVLKDVENMSLNEIGVKLGANPPGESNKIKRDHSTVRGWVDRGRDLLIGAWGEEG